MPEVDPNRLEVLVGRLLTEKKSTVAVAESCTGGLISSRLTDVAGSSAYFWGGVVSYSNEAKEKFLGVSSETLQKYGAVSSECALEMAAGIRRLANVDYAIAVTGIAGPGGGTSEKPVGTVHVALATKNGVQEKQYFFPLGRKEFKAQVASIALDTLYKELI